MASLHSHVTERSRNDRLQADRSPYRARRLADTRVVRSLRLKRAPRFQPSSRSELSNSLDVTVFTDRPVTDWATAKTADARKYAAFFRAMLEQGVYLAPSQFEAGFMSGAHREQEIGATLRAAYRALGKIADR